MIGSAIRLATAGVTLFVLLVACSLDDGEPAAGTSNEEPVKEFVPVLRDLSGVDELKSVISATEGPTAVPTEQSAPVLRDLTTVEALKSMFNEDAGKPRLLLLLDPA